MMPNRALFSLALLGALTLSTACSKADGAAEPATKPAAAKGDELSGEARAALDAAYAAYEKARAELAADETDGLPAAAAELKKAAEAAAAGGAPANLKPHLDALAAAAAKLGAGGDIEALRVTFGEVSKPLVAIGAAVPSLAASRHLFECPMAKGYKRWIQTTEKMANPYMGKKMLACGTKVDWKE